MALTAANAGDAIYYTLDGTEPTTAAARYTGPLSISSTTRIRAQAFTGTTLSGEESGTLYVARAINPTHHDIPVLILDGYGHGTLSTNDRSFVPVAVVGFFAESGAVRFDAQPDVVSHAGFHVRGQSSSSFPKVPYRLELRKRNDTDRNCPFFGMPSESDWALVGPYPDKTLVRNAFVYGLGRDIGLAAPRVAMVELYVNLDNSPLSEDDYQGVYQVVETIKNQQDRLNLQQLEPDDLTMPALAGGYIFKSEWLASEEPLVACPNGRANCWSDLEVVDPNPIAPEQMSYLTNLVTAFDDAIHFSPPSDPNSGYPAHIDEASFVDQVIIHELGRNMDGYCRSQYFYKDREGKIFAGPLWDYDLYAGVGMSGYGYPNLETSGWQYESNSTRMTSDWFPTLLADQAFRTKIRARWAELRNGPLSDQALRDRVNGLTAGLANAATRNFVKWDVLSSAMVGPFETPTVGSWQGQNDHMVTWMIERAAWLDTAW